MNENTRLDAVRYQSLNQKDSTILETKRAISSLEGFIRHGYNLFEAAENIKGSYGNYIYDCVLLTLERQY